MSTGNSSIPRGIDPTGLGAGIVAALLLMILLGTAMKNVCRTERERKKIPQGEIVMVAQAEHSGAIVDALPVTEETSSDISRIPTANPQFERV